MEKYFNECKEMLESCESINAILEVGEIVHLAHGDMLLSNTQLKKLKALAFNKGREIEAEIWAKRTEESRETLKALKELHEVMNG